MRNIIVSLIIPAYNVENVIFMTIDSVKHQTLKNFECIIVNDFSNDGTEAVVKDIMNKDNRFKLINHRANAGLSAARNTGLRFAKGKYVAFLDSDDLIMPESLEMRAHTLEKNIDDRVAGTYAGSITIDMECKVPPQGNGVKLKVIDFITAAGNCPFNANQPMFKTELFKKFGGFDHSLKQAEDYDMWMRVLRCGYKIIPTNVQLVTYRQTEGSMIRKNPLLHLDTSFKRFMNCYNPYSPEKWNSKFDKNLRAGLDVYLSQLNISNRVLEFIGLGLAKNDDIKDLLSRLLEYLPDYFEIIEGHRAFIPHVKMGIDRYFKKNIDLNSNEFDGLNKSLKELYESFKNISLVNLNQSDINIKKSLRTTEIVISPAVQELVDLIFIPHKDYHVHAIKLMKPFLDEMGVSFIIIDNSMHYRDEGVVRACEKYALAFVGYSNFILGNFKPKAVAVFNDWDPIVRSILLAAKKTNIATIGIVEGIQDYLDADTKQDRKAYRTVEYLFLPGEHDKKYFLDSDQKTFVGGVPRIYEMYKKRESTKIFEEKVALINSNFSYGVLEDCRDEWLTAAVDACKKSGFEPVITRHPADRGTLFPELVTSENFYDALEKCSVLISRFASGILEALAAKKLPIYFNLHHEKVDKFIDSKNAYPVINTTEDLTFLLNDFTVDNDYYLKFEEFLNYHCGDLSENPSEKISNDIAAIVQKSKQKFSFDNFFYSLGELDRKSGAFNNLKALRALAESYNDLSMINKNVQFPELSLKECNKLLLNREFDKARDAFSILKNTFPDNPAYKSGFETAKKYSEIYKNS